MRCLVYGVRQQGKSTLSMNLALRTRTDAGQLKSIIIFDPNSVFQGYFTVRSGAEFQKWLSAPENERWRIVVFRPTPGRIPEDFQELADLLGGSLWDFRNYVLICDEAASLQRASWLHPALERYLRQAPSSIDVIQTMHRPVDAHTLGRMLVTDTFYFFAEERRTLAIVEEQFGERIAYEVSGLGRHQFVHIWTDGGRRRYSVVRDPARWYTPINGEPRTSS